VHSSNTKSVGFKNVYKFQRIKVVI